MLLEIDIWKAVTGVALARTEKFKLKGFIPEETLVANNRTGRKKVQNLAGTGENWPQIKHNNILIKENKFKSTGSFNINFSIYLINKFITY